MGKFAKAWGAAVPALLFCGTLAAQTSGAHPEFQDAFSLDIGAYFPKAKTTAFMNSSTGTTGTSVSFENLLGVEDTKTVGVISGRFRFWDKWRIEAGYMNLDRSGSRTIGTPITWGDTTFPAGTNVQSKFQSETLRLSGGYSFIKDANKEFGVSLGLHTTKFDAELSAAAVGTARGDVLAPLPTLGVYGAYAFSPQWLLSGRVDVFSLNYDEYDGSLVDLMIKLDYRVHRNFAVGLGYRFVDYDVKVTESDYKGGINYKFNGPVLYGTWSF